jgi:hypothetical protein
MAVPRKAAPPSAPTKAHSMSENCRARNSDRKEGGQLRRRRSETCRGSGRPGEGQDGEPRTGRRGPAPSEDIRDLQGQNDGQERARARKQGM